MSLSPVAGVYDAAVLLLAAAGASKVARPADTATALRAVTVAGRRVPATAPAVRVAALAEVALALAALAAPGPVPGALVAVSYVLFAGFVAIALVRRLPLATCGCFGRPDSPPSWTHVAVDLAAAAAAVTWAASGGGAAASRTLAASQPAHGVPLAIAGVVAAGLAAAVLTDPLARARHLAHGGAR